MRLTNLVRNALCFAFLALYGLAGPVFATGDPDVPVIGSHDPAKGCPDMTLPEGRTMARYEERLPDPSQWNSDLYPLPNEPGVFKGSCVEFWGEGEYELSLALTADTPLGIRLLEHEPHIIQLAWLGGNSPAGLFWSESFNLVKGQSGGGNFHFRADQEEFAALASREDLPEGTGSNRKERMNSLRAAMADIRFVWTLRRHTQHPCSMILTVNGDVGKAVSGDVAYYNYFDYGVPKGAEGTWADPGMQALLQGLLEMTETVGGEIRDQEIGQDESAEYERKEWPGSTDVPDLAPNAAEAYGAEMREWFGLEGEGTGQSDEDYLDKDNFGLNLMDVKFETSQPDWAGPKPPVEGLAGAYAALASKVSLTVSGRLTRDPEVPEMSHIVQPSRVMAIVGNLDPNLEPMKYIWDPERQGGVRVGFIFVEKTQEIQGHLKGELYPERPRKGASSIRVDAVFRAQRGALSCQ